MRSLLVIVVVMQSFIVAGQKQTLHWVFGGYSGLDFSCPTPRFEKSQFSALEGGASISDDIGNLLMYTDGDVLFNRKHEPMKGGSGIGGLCVGFGGASSSQSAIFIPQPGNPTLYYLFTSDCDEDDFADGIRYSIIDISKDNGLGEVIQKNSLLIAPAAEKLAAVFHRNEKDVWLLTHGVGNNTFNAFLMTEAGLTTSPVVSVTGQVHSGGRGYLKFSPDGTRVAAASFKEGGDDGELPELFTFNDVTGEVKSWMILSGVSKSTYSLSFSPDGSKLYLSSAWTSDDWQIVQFDLSKPSQAEILSSAYRYEDEIQRPYGAMQLGPDGKLYFLNFDISTSSPLQPLALDAKAYVGVFKEPNKAGEAAQYVGKHIPFPHCGVRPSWGLPNFIESWFKTHVDLVEHCSASNAAVFDFDVVQTDRCRVVELLNNSKNLPEGFYLVTFGDRSDGWNGNDLGASIAHEYETNGTYEIRVYSYDFCTTIFSKTVTIQSLEPDFTFEQSCDDLKVTFDNTSRSVDGPARWTWTFDPSHSQVSEDAEFIFSQPGTYKVTLTGEDERNCIQSVWQDISVYSPLQVEFPDHIICPGRELLLQAPDLKDVSFIWDRAVESSIFRAPGEGVYSLMAIRGNCRDTTTFEVISDKDCLPCKLFIPNVFTPDHRDGLNETFRIDSDCEFFSFEMRIFNRYGMLIFESDDLEGWDGVVNDSDVPSGVYYYELSFTIRNSLDEVVEESRKGYVSLNR